MRYIDLIPIWPALDDESINHLKEVEKPRFLHPRRLLLTRLIVLLLAWWKVLKTKISRRVHVPDNLDDLSIGQVLMLSTSDDSFLPFREILHLPNEKIAMLDAEEAAGFLNFVRRELQRINELLASTKAEPTPEERHAGIAEVGKSVGVFGTIDYIAKRCNCSHDEAADINWKKAYAMMALDRDNELFRRRLTEIYQRKRK